MGLNEQIDQLVDMMQSATSGVAFTGAGISTESGIPDFRSPGGLWSKHKPVYYDEFLTSREARVRYWAVRVQMYREFAGAKPSAGHKALAATERAGLLRGVVTQNIDGLHQLAGSENVVEIHGTARRVGCIECDYECTPEEANDRVDAGDPAPDCPLCSAPLKSKTISFGQAMPHEEMMKAAQWSRDADIYLAVGSSLVVEPAASLPRLARDYGAKLIIITKTETPLDPLADLVIHEPIGRVFERAANRLNLDLA